MSESYLDTPVGRLRLSERHGAIGEIAWVASEDAGPSSGAEPASPLLAEASRQLDAYFAGRLHDFDLPLAPQGSDFERRVWREIAAIGYGEWRSYGALAQALGTAPRAVGRACGSNPIPIVVPCHRVLARDGGMGGYSGGAGLETKRALLELEGVLGRHLL